jgi:serine/threonine protein kinase
MYISIFLSRDLQDRYLGSVQSRRVPRLTNTFGSPHWMAPETFDGKGVYDEKIDIYAFAILLWELLTLDIPYKTMDITQIIAKVVMNDLRPEIPGNCPQPLREIIEKSTAQLTLEKTEVILSNPNCSIEEIECCWDEFEKIQLENPLDLKCFFSFVSSDTTKLRCSWNSSNEMRKIHPFRSC